MTIQRKLLLSRYEGEASSQLQQEVLQVVNQCLLQFSLIHMRIWLDLQELHYIGVFDDFFIFRFWKYQQNSTMIFIFCADLRNSQKTVIIITKISKVFALFAYRLHKRGAQAREKPPDLVGHFTAAARIEPRRRSCGWCRRICRNRPKGV